jgi:hypothetical protein
MNSHLAVDSQYRALRPAICDPSLLATRRGQVWVERLGKHGVNPACVAVPGAFFDSHDEWAGWSQRSFFGIRHRSWIWGTQSPDHVTRYDDRRGSADRIGWELREAYPSTSQIWTALGDGLLLAARRPRTLDVLASAGVVLRVASPQRWEDDGLPPLWPDLSPELTEALLRRTRFWCVQDREEQDTLRVLDFGWDTRR